jgi:hypothetical protein
MLDAVEAAEKPPDFVGAENDGQLRRRLRGRDDLGEHPVLLERDPVEEAQGGECDGTGSSCMGITYHGERSIFRSMLGLGRTLLPSTPRNRTMVA